MEAAPRLPMISFDLLLCGENVHFGPKLKPYIANFYGEDPESYITEIDKLDNLRASAVHPTLDVVGIQNLKRYYCQIHFLKSRFPMNPGEMCFIEFEWKSQPIQHRFTGGLCLELSAIMHNIGVLHTILGARESRLSPEGMKLACSHFQCAVWAFQFLKEEYSDSVEALTHPETPHFYKQVCLAQAQECILEKSMLDNRKSSIISKVAVQVWNYYRRSLSTLKLIGEEVVGRTVYKEWSRYLQFKIAYHRCISLLFQGQQAEEMQKMGARVAFYQGACDSLQEVYKNLDKNQTELLDAIAFTADVVEGKKKAANNENEYIYHEEVPDLSRLKEAEGASLVKGIDFSVNDPEVSGPDIFSRLVPMEAHEAASVYSEKKADILRKIGTKIELKDQQLVELLSSMHLDMLTKVNQATGIPQEIIDRAASVSAKHAVLQDLIDCMAKLSNIYFDVEHNLREIDSLLKEEEASEKKYQDIIGKRPPSIITTDLAREALKYHEAHTKAKDSNDNLSKAMATHVENLKILQMPIKELQQALPSISLPDPNIDESTLSELEVLNAKVEEMKSQRTMLWAQLKDAIRNDDITQFIVQKQQNQSVEDIFNTQIQKHSSLIDILEQNLSAQDNIQKALVDTYARAVHSRRYIMDVIQKRNSTLQSLITSYDSYDDLNAKVNKGIEFYTKLDTNVSKLLQKIKSAIKVQQEERDQMLSTSDVKSDPGIAPPATTNAPKLKDYLDARKKSGSMTRYASQDYSEITDSKNWPPSVRPIPIGSEITKDTSMEISNQGVAIAHYPPQNLEQNYSNTNYNQYHTQPYSQYESSTDPAISQLSNRMSALLVTQNTANPPISTFNYPQYAYGSYPGQMYTTNSQAPSSSCEINSDTITANSNETISSSYPYLNYDTHGVNYQQYQTPYAFPSDPSSFYGQNTNNSLMNPQNVTPNQFPSQGQTQLLHQQYQNDYSQSKNVQLPEGYQEHSLGYTQHYPDQIAQSTYNQTNDNQTVHSLGYDANNIQSYGQPQIQYQNSEQVPFIPYTPPQATYTYPSDSTFGYNQDVLGNEKQFNNKYPDYGQQGYDLSMNNCAQQSNIDLLTGLDFSSSNSSNVITLQPVSSKSPDKIVSIMDVKPSPKSTQPIKETSKKDTVKVLPSKVLDNNEVKNLFLQEINKYQHYTENLTVKTSNRPSTLDLKWREIQENQDMDAQKKIISVARCYPMKNRFPDILPYDHARVELKTTSDDYINASHVEQISPFAPKFIVTQAPLPSTQNDFWAMVVEQEVELIFCLLNDKEIGDDVYWPKDKNQSLTILDRNLVVSLLSVQVKANWTERLISVNLSEKKESRVVVTIQFTSWPGSLFPTTPMPFLDCVVELINLFQKQKSLKHPILVHCFSGIGRSGVLCLLTNVILEVTNRPESIPDLTSFTMKLNRCCKNVLRDREHLKFSYEAMLCYMKKTLAIDTDEDKKILEETIKESATSEKVVDPLSSLDPFWANK